VADSQTAGQPPAGQAGTGETDRIRSLDEQAARLDRIEAALAARGGGQQGQGQGQGADPGQAGRPATVEEQVRAELERARKEAEAKAAADKAKGEADAERESVAQRLKRLEERPPAAPVHRKTRLLGWGDGRR
jgi:hypothetical protein